MKFSVCIASSILFILLIPFQIFGSGRYDIRNLKGYNKIVVETSCDVVIVQGSKEGVLLEGPNGGIKRTETSIEGNTLFIEKSGLFFFLSTKGVKCTIYVKNINSVIMKSSGTLTFEKLSAREFGIQIDGSGKVSGGEISADYCAIDISGSGTVSLAQITTKDTDIKISGNGDVRIGGQAKKCRLKISGSGVYRSENFLIDTCDILVSGSGDTVINVSSLIRVEISGSGTVKYIGKPRIEIISISGSGKVTPYK